MTIQSTDLELVQSALTQFDAVAAGIAALNEQYGGVLFEVSTPKGYEDAKSARALLRQPRFEVEAIRKDAKAPLLAIGKRLDAEAARITAELLKIESPIDAQVKTEESRREHEKQARIDAEMRRVADLHTRIHELRGAIDAAANSSSRLILEHIDKLEQIPVDDSFQEFLQQAQHAKDATLAQLERMYTAAIGREAEKARIAEEREELALLRAAQAQREADDRARMAEDERKAKELRDAEAARQTERLNAEWEETNRKRAEQAEADRITRQAQQEADRLAKAERDRVAQVETDRLAAEIAQLKADREKFDAEQADARRVEEERQAAEQRKSASRRKSKRPALPSADDIITAVGASFSVPPETAREWLIVIDFRVKGTA